MSSKEEPSSSGGFSTCVPEGFIVPPMFSQRIVNVDFYTSYPVREFDSTFSEFRRTDVSRVPVLRIFGSTPQGQKTCTHIHGVFPYISVLDDPSIDDLDHRICSELDKALNDFLGSAVQNRSARSNQHHVFNITKVRGRTYYGFRCEEETFLRIYFYNPLVIKKAVDLLGSGRILGKTFQPYEAHIPYQLQFMIDFNLYGMNLIHYTNVKFRRNAQAMRNPGSAGQTVNPSHRSRYPSVPSSGGAMTLWELSQLPNKYFSSESLEKWTTCELEIDVLASDVIITLPSSSSTKSINPGIDAIWKDERERRRQQSVENWSQITIPESQDRLEKETLALEKKYKNILEDKLNRYVYTESNSQITNRLENSFPSSQVQTYTPSSITEDGNSILRHDDTVVDEEDEELLNLLYEMQQEKESNELDGLEDLSLLSCVPEPEIDADRSFEENVDDRQDVQWNQSLLSQTIIDEFMSSGNMEIAENNADGVAESGSRTSQASQSNVIFQGDGQGDEDDSHQLQVTNDLKNTNSTEDVSSPVRRSGRKRTLTSKLQEYASNKATVGHRSEKSEERPINRLSMSARRKARRSSIADSTSKVTPGSSTMDISRNIAPVVDNNEVLAAEIANPDLISSHAHHSKLREKVSSSDFNEASYDTPPKSPCPSTEQESTSVVKDTGGPTIRVLTAKPTGSQRNSFNSTEALKRNKNVVYTSPGLSKSNSRNLIQSSQRFKSPIHTYEDLHVKTVLPSKLIIPLKKVSSSLITRIKEIGVSKALQETKTNRLTLTHCEPKLKISQEESQLSTTIGDNSELKQLTPTDPPEVEISYISSAQEESQLSTTVGDNSELKQLTPTDPPEVEISYISSAKTTDGTNTESTEESSRPADIVVECSKPYVSSDSTHDVTVIPEKSFVQPDLYVPNPPLETPGLSQNSNLVESPSSPAVVGSRSSVGFVSSPSKRTQLSATDLLVRQAKTIRKKLISSKASTGRANRMLSSDSHRLSPRRGSDHTRPKTVHGYDSPSLFSQHDAKSVRQSFFEIKKVATMARARKRRFKKIALELQEDNAENSFSQEYEPLFEPEPHKWVMYNMEQQRLRKETYQAQVINNKPAEERNQGIAYNENSSDEEAIEDVRKCFGESSDEDERVSSPTKANEVLGSQQSCTLSSTTDIRDVDSHSVSSNRGLSVGLSQRKFCWEDKKLKRNVKKIDNEGVNVSVLKPADRSELDGPSLINQFGFAHDMSNLQEAKAVSHHQYITLMSVEVLCKVREDLTPDPKRDAIDAIFLYICNDVPDDFRKPKNIYKCLLVHPFQCNVTNSTCEYYANERDLFEAFIRTFHECDPDMLVGYETEKMSFGYIIDRGYVLNLEMTKVLSRLLPKKKSNQPFKQESWDGQIQGRIVLNLWRLMRHEITVTSYTYENVAYHVLHRKVCKFSFPMLAEMWSDIRSRSRVMEYFKERVVGVTELMEKLDMINRTSELARLFGIQFYEVFSRGSQFRVESMMLRTAKPMNFIAPSPSVNQRAKMRAPEFLPLILEPQSRYYTNPVAVLDFQSLYPSMIIAYNYDYSTVLGRVEHLVEDCIFELGCLETIAPPHILKELKDHIHISPAGVAFVTPSITRGILPQMLEQILDTRQMVKRAMKKWKNSGPTLQKILDSRQLGLKLIANVTYGYTSANFSGRMPCVEIADSVVSKGRETLQRAIDMVKNEKHRWGGNVVYGDTDSMFIEFPGKDRREAFKLAQEIADEVTKSNPKPVKLKLEKIYQPCILQTKKRYVGYAYETPEQESPVYDAKGIETVRRDGCPAVKKILEKCLHVLFITNDPEKVKTYVQLQFKKLFTGRVSMKEYTFARAFRGREGYKPGACVPALEIAKRLTEKDPRAEPLTKQRVPYVVVYGKPTLPLIQLVRTPNEFVMDYTLRLNAHYYIEKVIIPALNRCFALAKIDVSQWYRDLPRKYLRSILDDTKQGQGTLDDFVHHANCFRCDEKTQRGICLNCDSDLMTTASFLLQSATDCSKKLEVSREICETCSGYDDKCTNTDCPVFHKLLRYERDEYYNRQKLLKLKNIEF